METIGLVPVLELTVDGLPPAKSEAKSMMSSGHQHADRVFRLLEAAKGVQDREGARAHFGVQLIGLGLTLRTVQADPPSDAMNYLGGVADVLEHKVHRTDVEHLGDLWDVHLYSNDRQVREVQFKHERASADSYTVRIWPL